jgi:hypothetical protein
MTPAQVRQLPPPVSRPINFATDIKPILEASCVKCHGRGKAKGGFRLDTRETFLKEADSGPVVVIGRSAESYLIELVAGVDPDNVMPQKGSKLKPEQISLLRAWIDQGLPWAEGVSFAKAPPLNLHPRQPELPPARSDLPHPIDRLLDPYFAQRKIPSARIVDDRTFARRAYLDLIGLLPSPDELQAFVGDKRPDKREWLVGRLLADNRRYAEHWLTFWNDLLRNDYRGTGYIDGGRKQISSWLFAALAKNMPYDRFVAELVNPTPESEGFVKGIVWRGVVNASQVPQMQAAQNISQVFLGVNLKCASCHDSFINDWALADAYGMASVYADEPLEMHECDKPNGKKVAARFLYPELGEIPADAPQTERRKRLAEILVSKQNGRLTRTIVNRLWQKFLGRGLVEPVDDLEQAAWHPDLLDWLAEDLASHGYDLKRTMKLILTSRAYQLPAVSMDEQKHADYVFTGPAVRRMSAEQFRDALGTLTGVWFETPAAQFDFSAGSAEEQFKSDLMPKKARWIWSETAAAQRALPETVYFWKSFTLEAVPEEAFVVASCDNSFTLYVNGAKALSGKDFTQPNFANIRAHLRAGSNTLTVSAINHRPDNSAPTADQPPQESEANPAGFILYVRLRDHGQVLDFATDASWTWSKKKADGWESPGFAPADGQAAAELGEASVAPWSLDKKLLSTMSVAQVHGEVRSSLVPSDPLAVALGRPPREQLLTVRPSAATTLQALELTNGETLAKVVKRGAEKVLAHPPSSNADLVNGLYAKALGRRPSSVELKLADELLGQPASREHVEDLLWALAMLPEFQLIY